MDTALLRTHSCLIIDLDGVVYAGNDLLPGAADAIRTFRRAGKKIGFLTNNSMKSPAFIHSKLVRLGVECDVREIITSGEAAASLIRERNLDESRGVFVVGSSNLHELLQAAGARLANAENCGALLVGMKPDFSYSDITAGLKAALRGVPFIACNRDANYPGTGGELLPGCGAMVGAIESASLRRADYVVGKPETRILMAILKRIGAEARDCLVVGDTLDSDILMAHRANVPCALITSPVERLTFTEGLSPAITAASLQELAGYL